MRVVLSLGGVKDNVDGQEVCVYRQFLCGGTLMNSDPTAQEHKYLGAKGDNDYGET